MKDTRRKLNLYTIFDFPKIEKSLEKMALEGWMLYEAKGNFWKYQRMEPKKLRFSVMFLPKVSAFDPEPTEQSADLADFASRTGWKHVASASMMQIFCNENPDAIPMETDPIVQVDTIHKTVKKNLLWSWVILMLVSFMNVAIRFTTVGDNFTNFITDRTQLLMVLCWAVIALESLFHVVSYYLWYKKAKAEAENGEFIRPRSNMMAYYSILAVLFALSLWLTFEMYSTLNAKFILYIFGYMAVIFGIVWGLIKMLKSIKMPGKYTIIIVYIIGTVVSFVIIGGLIHLILGNNDHVDPAAAGTYEHNGRLIEYYLDEIPLRVEDMEDVDYEHYSTRNEKKSSIFASMSEIRQRDRIGDNKPDLEYIIVDVKIPLVYDMILRDIIAKRDETDDEYAPEGHKQIYEEIDGSEWCADKAYQLVSQEFGGIDHYILCYDNRIVEMVFYDFSPDTDDKLIAGEKLMAYN